MLSNNCSVGKRAKENGPDRQHAKMAFANLLTNVEYARAKKAQGRKIIG